MECNVCFDIKEKEYFVKQCCTFQLCKVCCLNLVENKCPQCKSILPFKMVTVDLDLESNSDFSQEQYSRNGCCGLILVILWILFIIFMIYNIFK